MSPARAIAARVLVRVLEDRAFAAAALDTELDRAAQAGLAPRDAALATELVYGVLRTLGFLEAELAELAKRGRGPDDAEARAHVFIALYSIAFLDRIPTFAAVSEAVDAVRARLGKSPAGFVNAVLRAFAAKVERDGRPSLDDALVRAAPGWLRGALRRSLGRRGAELFLAAGAKPPPITLAVRTASERASIIEALTSALASTGATFAPCALSPRGILATGIADPDKLAALPELAQRFIVQEEGAQLIALALAAKPGEVVLDACAGRGNKTWLLSADVGPTGRVIAVDRHPDKLARLAARLASPTVETHAIDWTAGTGSAKSYNDVNAILVDAPCSGSGTLRRRPEIALSKDAENLAELARMQVAIVRSAATLARPGARLVYAVCSVLREECEDVVAKLVEPDSSGVRLVPRPLDVPDLPRLHGRDSLRLLPHEDGTDGYFIASFTVERAGAR
ncbi:MAG: transcription antitermination factor NusB [Polyangiaceae bacterium]